MGFISKITKYMTDEKYRYEVNDYRGRYNNMPDEEYLKLSFKNVMGRELDLENPKSFNEKLQWLKLHDRNPEYIRMVDKAQAKDYVAERIGEEYIIPTLGIWDRVEDIDWDALPDQFVLKVTHDSGGLVVCKDKKSLDRQAAMEKLQASLNTDYYIAHREWPYKDVPRKIIAEKFMKDDNTEDLRDYKFYCFNGEPKFLYLSEGLQDHSTAKISFVNLDWTFADFGRSDYAPFRELPPKPDTLDDMIALARKLSQGMRFVRIDLYDINGKIYFGEITFFPCTGQMPFSPASADYTVGELLKL